MKNILNKFHLISLSVGLVLLCLIIGIAHSADDTWTAVDDTEERNGVIRSATSKMHYVYWENDNQYAAFRFEGVNIPAGSVITSATFRVDKIQTKDKDDCSVEVYGQLSPNPAAFGAAANDISGRPLTSNSVSWNAVKEKGTPDLKKIIQELVDQTDWDLHQTIVLITKSNKEDPDTHVRVAAEEQDKYKKRPKLTIVWESAPPAAIKTNPDNLGPTCFVGYDAASMSFELEETSDTIDFVGTISSNKSWISFTVPNGGFTDTNPLYAGTKETIGVHFDTDGLAAGTHTAEIHIAGNITNSPKTVNVTLVVKAVPISAACGEIPLYAENLINPAIMVQLDTSGSMGAKMPILTGGKNPRTPSLVDIVQEIVKRPPITDPAAEGFPADGWEEGNDMAFVITGIGRRRAYSYDGQSLGGPKLTITYNTGGTSIDVEYRIANSGSDVQHKGSSLKTNEDYLEMGRAGNPVGLVFEDIDIPNNATIESAEIQFVISSGDAKDTYLTVYGIATDSAAPFTALDQLNDTDTYSTEFVDWSNVESWDSSMSRIDIAEDVLKEVFLDRSISWGFATWAGGSCNSSNSDNAPTYYTNYRIGVHAHDAVHQTQLQNKADDGHASGCTPLAPTMKAAHNYFTEQRKDAYYNEYFADYDCQPRIAVIVTDGIGNTATTMAKVEARTNELLAEGISVVAIGFGISESSAGQLYKIAELAQAAGKVSDDDFVYSLHKEDGTGKGLPYLAQSREDFITAMTNIVSSVKAQAFHGSAPAATTSADNGEVLLSSTFDASNWTGNVTATKFDYYTGALESTDIWTAKGSMPGTINGFIYDGTSASKVSAYSDLSLGSDNYLCKPLGDIINSTPKIVGKPAYWYRFDNYSAFKYNSKVFNRDSLAYVAANDGALHALNLSTGIEEWRFYPDAVKTKLNQMGVDPTKDMCSSSYCHEFIFDGSPQAADIHNGSAWKTIVVTGLGEGGSAFVALDVTYGNDLGSAVSANEEDTPSKFLWEFTDAELGLATAFPEIERVVEVDAVGAPSGATWATLFGSGPLANDLAQKDKEAYLYGINSWDASPIWLDSTSANIKKVKLSPVTLKDDVAGPPLAVDLGDNQLNNRVYVTNMYGNMYRVGNVGDGQKPYVDTFFYSGKTDHSTAATAKPAYAYHDDADHDGIFDIWLYYGTGKYIDQIDKITTDQQYFYGLYEVEGSSENTTNTQDAAYTPSDLETMSTSVIEAYALDENGDPVDLSGNGSVGSEDLQKYRTISCTSPVAGQCNPNNLSWKLELATGGNPSERSLNQPLVVAGIVFFVTFIPDGDPCEGNGDAWLFAVDYETGAVVSDAVFDINNDGKYDDSDKTVKETDDDEHGVGGIYIGEGKPNDPVIHGDVLFVGTSGTPPKPIKVNLPGAQARLKAWRQLFN